MDLVDFLRQTQAEVRSEIGERLGSPGNGYPYAESVFAEVVMQHMSQIGMTFDPQICHYAPKKVGSAILRLSGYAMSDETDQLDLFGSLYSGVDDVTPITDTETKTAAEQSLRFLAKCAEGRLAKTMDESDDAYAFAVTIQDCYPNLDQIRIYVLTDRQAKAKNFKPREVSGKTVKLEVMDIERLHRHWSEGKPRDELVVNFEEVSGGALPCVYVPGEAADYDYAMTVIPGEALRFVYEKYGGRLLEANVRSFLSATAKVNKGIRDTLQTTFERFMAYNNGIVIVADEVHLGKTGDGGPGILWLKGMQIVNGGQTTASIYFSKKKNPEIDLRRARVPAKIIALRSQDSIAEEALISDMSRFANSQTSVKLSDLSANKPFHVQIENLALSTYCPDGIGRWFYERAAGSYNTMLLREGTTPARLRQLKESIPTSRRITKTDLAKYLNAWAQRPDSVSFGTQKNSEKFMADLTNNDLETPLPLPDVPAYKLMIAKAILFKKAHALVRPMFQQAQANIAAYVVSLVANRIGPKLDLDKIWLRQDISAELKTQLQTWAGEVNKVLHDSAGGRMISEWAKKAECWTAVRGALYTEPVQGIPEVR
jgi:hypothetical protein